jgi:hypothetical protein
VTDREIVIYLAKNVMGWSTTQGEDPDSLWLVVPGGHVAAFWVEGKSGANYWNPLESIVDAYEVGMRLPVEDRAFLHRFMKALDHIACVDKGRLTGGEQFWLEVHATPRQRCMAILQALEVKE